MSTQGCPSAVGLNSLSGFWYIAQGPCLIPYRRVMLTGSARLAYVTVCDLLASADHFIAFHTARSEDRDLSRRHSQLRVFVRDQSEAGNQSRRAGLPSVSILQRWVPAGILTCVEDLRRGVNADVGQRNFLETASNDVFRRSDEPDRVVPLKRVLCPHQQEMFFHAGVDIDVIKACIPQLFLNLFG